MFLNTTEFYFFIDSTLMPFLLRSYSIASTDYDTCCCLHVQIFCEKMGVADCPKGGLVPEVAMFTYS